MTNTLHSDKRLLIPLREAAEMLGMCCQTVMKFVYEGDLDCVRFSAKSVFFTHDDLNNFIQKFKMHHSPLEVPDI